MGPIVVKLMYRPGNIPNHYCNKLNIVYSQYSYRFNLFDYLRSALILKNETDDNIHKSLRDILFILFDGSINFTNVIRKRRFA